MPTTPRPVAPIAACGLAIAGTTPHALAQGDPLLEPFPAVLTHLDLDGQIGFRVEGVSTGDLSGSSVAAAGDLNGDGIDDFVIGALRASRFPAGDDGNAYVIFGRQASAGNPFPAGVRLADLDGSDGFRILGADSEGELGSSVAAAGDLNGDGISDLIVGAPKYGRPSTHTGAAYVIFGRDSLSGATFPESIDLAGLGVDVGFRLQGADGFNFAGASVAGAGDINGDGFDDVIVGAPRAYLSPGGVDYTGISYVVLGRDTSVSGSFPAVVMLDELDGADGFGIVGVEQSERSGHSVSSAGDFNGDGIGDVIIGAIFAGHSTRYGFNFGASYVVFGRDTAAAGAFPAILNLADLDGANGVRFEGVDHADLSGTSVADAGDVNGDGVDDVIIGATGVQRDGRSFGSSFVVFGRDTAVTGPFAAIEQLSDLDGLTGFRLDAGGDDRYSGTSVSGAGDINGDGVDDVLVGAIPPGSPGSCSIIFGRKTSDAGPFPEAISLTNLDGTNGFRFSRTDGSDYVGASVAAAGDVNGDGQEDIIVGGPQVSTVGSVLSGTSYIVYGRDVAACPADLDGDGELTIFDFLAFQNLFDAMDPAADFDGDGDFTIFDFLAFQNAFDAGCP
ncbi:MAG: integrin alpha [Phycisphaera sp.]|nr:MAG: integrin alpha [Phycisphaera sp.]